MNVNSAKKTILIIDDNEHILKPLSLLLSSLGYLVRKTINGKDPLIMQKPFADLVLLDARLSDSTGKDICRQIKRNNEMSHIPVIMFSADNQIRFIAKEAGADDFIEKPFRINDLSEKIKKHINKKLGPFQLS